MSEISEEALDVIVTKIKPIKKKKRFFWKVFFVFILAGLIAVSYYYFRRHHSAYKITQVTNSQLAQNNQIQIQQMLQQQQQLLDQQNQIMARLQKHGMSEQPLVLANVIFLLRRAQLQLYIEQDPIGAINLLQIASASLQRLNSRELDGVQQAITTDMKMLQMIKMPNVNQLAHQFYRLSQQVSHLSLALGQQALQKPTQAKQLQGWKKAVDNAWQSLRDVIVVERTDKSFKPLMNQQDLFSFKQYMQSLLQQTLWAALKQNNTIYHSSLKQLQHALSANVAKTNADAMQLQQELAALQLVNVQPAIPKQINALRVAEITQNKLLLAPRKVA